MKIRQKLIILLLCIGFLPALVIGVVAYQSMANQVNAETIRRLTTTQDTQIEKLNLVLRNDQQFVTNLTTKYELQRDLSRTATGSGRNINGILDLLDTEAAKNNNVETITIAGQDNVVIASTDRTELGTAVTVDPDLVAVPNGPTTFALTQDPKTKAGKLYVSASIGIDNKEPVLIVVKFSARPFETIIRDYAALGGTGETIIAGQTSKGSATSLFPLRFDLNAAFKIDLSSLGLGFRSDAKHTDLLDYRGKRVFVVTNYLALARWSVATKLDRSEALTPLTGLRNTVIFIAAITTVATVLLAVILTRSLTRPIVNLTNKARQIAQGNLQQRITITSRDEIGVLGTTFNQMATQLGDLYRSLEQKVIDRTQQLDQKVTELGRAKAKDEAILSSIGEGMIVTDSQGMVLLVNALAAKLLDKSAESLTGRPITNLKLCDQNGEILPPEGTPLIIALKTTQRAVQEVWSVFSDGSKLTLSITATPVIQNQQVIGVIQIIRDVTKEKEVDRMKTEFISLASHQLRTPLSAIKWFGEMLLAGDAGKLNDEQQGFAQNISDSTERMIELVSSLLNISRIESGRIIIDPEPTDLKKLVEELAVELQVKLDEKKQHFALSVHNELPLINVDPQLTRQVYLNLLTNAIKYTPEGGQIAVMISRNGDEMLSQVTDTGYGIPKAQQGKVFQKFFRAENITKIITDGTGLGLYLIKAIVDSQHGKIWFDSEEGKGTTFWFTLPMAGVEAKKGEVTIE